MENDLLVRNGILGGDTMIHLDNIDCIIKINKTLLKTGVVKIGLFNGLEKNNIAIYLKEPVNVIKAFGIKKKAKVILLSIDKCENFIAAMGNAAVSQKS